MFFFFQLKNNRIDEISNLNLDSLIQLKVLILSDNQIRIIDEFQMQNLTNLEQLIVMI